MKTNSWMLQGLALSFLLTLSGCRESYTAVTTLFPDGSCDRIITITSNSRNQVPDVAMAFPLDSTWEVSWKEPKEKEGKYEFTAKKHYAHFDSLAGDYARMNNPEKIRISVSLEKRFRWFYTYFSYRERYALFNPFGALPPSRFMTVDEVRRCMAGEKSDSLKNKRDAWEMRNIFEEYYRGLVNAARELQHPSLPVSLIEARKEALYDELMGGGSDDAVRQTARVLRTSAVWKIEKRLQAAIQEIERKSNIAMKADGDYVNTVVLPGTILDTNAEEVKGSSVVWRFSDERFDMSDFEMMAESRSVNVWAMALTGLVVLALVIVPGVAHRRYAHATAR